MSSKRLQTSLNLTISGILNLRHTFVSKTMLSFKLNTTKKNNKDNTRRIKYRLVPEGFFPSEANKIEPQSSDNKSREE